MTDANYTTAHGTISCIIRLDQDDRFDIDRQGHAWRAELLHIQYRPRPDGTQAAVRTAWAVCRRDDEPEDGRGEPWPIRLDDPKRPAPRGLLDLVDRYRPRLVGEAA